MRFCEMLQEIQRTKGYPIYCISELTGIAYSTVRSHFNGRSFPSRNMFLRYNAIFHFVDPDDAWAITDFYYDLKSRK